MNTEKQTIASILSQFPGAVPHQNKFHESDAEIIRMGNERIAFSTDGFSAEDLFRDDDPYSLGWNLAVATISDILASGGEPEFFAHSVVAKKPGWDHHYLQQMARGTGDILNLWGSAFIGGDLGTSSQWHYTGICFGSVKKNLSRKGAVCGDPIYMTGKIGAGNLEAALTLYSDHRSLRNSLKNFKTYFQPRMAEARIIREHAACCIDTSDGLLNALNTIAEINHVGFEITGLPYLKEGLDMCRVVDQPKELLMMGECGEYELLFAIKQADEEAFINHMQESQLKMTKIGYIADDGKKVLHDGNRQIGLSDFFLSARDYGNVNDYIRELAGYIRSKQ